MWDVICHDLHCLSMGTIRGRSCVHYVLRIVFCLGRQQIVRTLMKALNVKRAIIVTSECTIYSGIVLSLLDSKLCGP